LDQLEYYAYLATTLPPGGLARAAARKIARRASRAFHSRPDPTDRDVLNAFCARDGRDLAFKLSAPRASSLWADASRRQALAEVAGRLPGLIGRVIERADRAWARDFTVFGRRVSFGRSPSVIDWHLDPLHGGRFDARGVPERAGLDPKGPWALGRFEQALALAQGTWLSPLEEDRARFACELSAQVRHFARENPVGASIHWASPMEVALRAANLSLAFLMLRHRPELQDAQFALCFARLLLAHGRFVEDHLEFTGAVPNNHYVANLVGLLHLGVIFPELPGARAWRSVAEEGLRAEIERQVLDDGFSFEGSTGYHRLSTELFTLALFAANAGRIDLGESYRLRLHAMYRAVARYVTEAGLAPQVGDNDSGRAIPLCDRASLDHGYLLPLGAALFQDPELKRDGVPYCDEALFLMGPAGLERFERLPESGLSRSVSLPRAGLYFLRSRDAYCAIACGPNGQAGIGGHGHNDKLGVEIHIAGRPVIVDPGSPCYTSDPEKRNLYRSTAAHSTLQIDGEEQSRLPAQRLFALPDSARARMLRFESTPLCERFAGEHRGYERLSPAVRHRREVTFHRGARAFLIVDRLTGGGEREVVARFHLPDPQARVRPASPEERERLLRLVRVGELDLANAVELGPEGAPLALLAVTSRAPPELRRFDYSPGYGELREARCVEVGLRAELPLELVAALMLLAREGEGEGT
jgi:hypothetical protein